MNDFITWETLANYTTFVSMVFMIVEFTKQLGKIKKIPTKIWSFIISFFLLLIMRLAQHTFHFIDMLLYILSAMTISLSSNGLSDFNYKKPKDS